MTFNVQLGGFSPNDGTIDFYLRVASLVTPDSVLLDLGAGRAGWFEDDDCATRHAIRTLKGRVAEVIAADVDAAVLANRASDRQLVMRSAEIPLPDASCDTILADYVLEHIADVPRFVAEAGRVLKPGGWFCARTPHKYSYLAAVSRMVGNSSHSRLLAMIQPRRQAQDIFPAFYRLNTRRALRHAFPGWHDASFVYVPEPAYHFGSKAVFAVQDVLHKLLWREFSGHLFVFLRNDAGR